MEIPEAMNVWADWGNYTTGPARYESLAEECTELAQAALKMARLIRGENPTPIKRGEAETNLQEEFTDVISCAIALNLEVNAKLSVEKFHRMHKRHIEQEIENTFSIIDDENLTTDVSPVIHGGD